MVGGVSPSKAGQMHLGLPVFGSVKEVRRLNISLRFVDTITRLSEMFSPLHPLYMFLRPLLPTPSLKPLRMRLASSFALQRVFHRPTKSV